MVTTLKTRFPDVEMTSVDLAENSMSDFTICHPIN